MRGRPALTFFLSLWKGSRAMFGVLAVGIVGAYVFLWFADAQELRPGAGEASEDLIVALLLISLPAMVMTASAILANSDADRLSIAVPPRVLRLPLATWKISGILAAFGILAVSLVALAGAIPALVLLNVEFAWWLPVLTAATIVPLVQLWAITFGNASPRVALVSFVIFFGALSATARQPFFVRLVTEGSLVVNAVASAGFVVAVFGLLWAVIGVQRRGGWAASLPRRVTTSREPRPLRPFRSARVAQFWYEWRQYGLLLPVYVVGTALAYFLGLPLVVGLFRVSDVTGQSSNEPLFVIDWFSSAQFITTGLGLAALVGSLMVGGVLFMRGGHWNAQSSYLLTRPLTLARISNARLLTIALSALAALAGLLALTGALELFTNFRGDTTGIGLFLHQGYEQLPQWVAVSIFLAGILLIMWTCAWSTGYVYVLGVAVAIVGPPMAVVWGAVLFGVQDVEAARGQTEWLLPILQWSAAGVVVLGYLALAWIADSKRLIHVATPWVSAVVWLAFSAGFVYYVKKWDAPITAREWYVRFPHPVVWPFWVGVSVVPLLPGVLHPLLLERVRHR